MTTRIDAKSLSCHSGGVRALPMPSYLPEAARYVVPWARAKVLELAGKNPDIDLGDLWDEAISALVRAAHYFDPETNRGAVVVTFKSYAQTAVVRGLWRYTLPNLAEGQHRRRRRRLWEPLRLPAHRRGSGRAGEVDHPGLPPEPSAEEVYGALERGRLLGADGIADGTWPTDTPKASRASLTAAAAARIPKAPKAPTKATPPPTSRRRSGKAATTLTATAPSHRSTKEPQWPTPMAMRK